MFFLSHIKVIAFQNFHLICGITTVIHCHVFRVWQRRGVIEGVDYGATGEVKKVDVSRMRERLDGGCIVILSNLGYSSSGEVLNCKYAL